MSRYWNYEDAEEELEGLSSAGLLDVLKAHSSDVEGCGLLGQKSEVLSNKEGSRVTPRAPCADIARVHHARLSDRRGRLEISRESSDDAEARKSWAWADDLEAGEIVRPDTVSRLSTLPSSDDPPGITRAAFRRMAAPVFALVREARALYRTGQTKQARNRMMAAEARTAELLGEESTDASLQAALRSAQGRMYRVAGDAEQSLARVLRNAWLYDWTNAERCIRRLRELHFPGECLPTQLTPLEWDLVRAGNPLLIILTYPVIVGTIRAQMRGKPGQDTAAGKWGRSPTPRVL